ncbi:hypothetical protein ACFL3T_00165 [Patescibacteria group bacterium]
MNENTNAFHDHVLTWEAPEYIQHEKTLTWFIVAAILVLALIVYGFFISNWTMIVAIVVIAALYIWLHGQSPKHVKILISRTGIKFGEKEIPYQNITNFWILYHPPHIKTLNIKSNSRFYPDLSIELGDQDPAELRTFLCAHVREFEGREEHFSDTLVRILKL